MSDKTLRSGLIRLAHSNPELRPQLLPLIKSARDNDANLYELYDLPGVDKANETIESTIWKTSEEVKRAVIQGRHQLTQLIRQYEDFGTSDSDAELAIWTDFSARMQAAIRSR